jgi:hypothetical protein
MWAGTPRRLEIQIALLIDTDFYLSLRGWGGGDSRQTTLGCFAPGSRLPAVPMGLADPLHLAHPLYVAADSDLVLDLPDPLHLAHPDSNSTVPNGSGDDAGSESSKETALQAPLPDQSHHPREGEAEDGDCHPVVDRPCLHAIG